MNNSNDVSLPPPLPGHTGWPWTSLRDSCFTTAFNREYWPKISIVTPSLNQGQFLEQTIRSVLLQGYPNLEYIVIDGGSTDNTINIIRKYEPWLSYWVSEPDNGQAHALNKGFQRVNGDIIGWINSDDMYCENTFWIVANWFNNNQRHNALYGGIYIIDEKSDVKDGFWPTSFNPSYTLLVGLDVHQQGLFWKKSLMNEVGLLDENLSFAMDLDFIVRILFDGNPGRIKRYLGMFRHQPQAKTALIKDVGIEERKLILNRYINRIDQTVRRNLFSVRKRRLSEIFWEVGPKYYLYKLCRRANIKLPRTWLGG